MSFDDLLKDLQGQREMQEDPDNVKLEDLFHPDFMKKYTNFDSFGAFLEQGNFQVETHEDIAKIPDELFDRHISRETKFEDWASMLETADQAYKSQ